MYKLSFSLSIIFLYINVEPLIFYSLIDISLMMKFNILLFSIFVVLFGQSIGRQISNTVNTVQNGPNIAGKKTAGQDSELNELKVLLNSLLQRIEFLENSKGMYK